MKHEMLKDLIIASNVFDAVSIYIKHVKWFDTELECKATESYTAAVNVVKAALAFELESNNQTRRKLAQSNLEFAKKMLLDEVKKYHPDVNVIFW